MSFFGSNHFVSSAITDHMENDISTFAKWKLHLREICRKCKFYAKSTINETFRLKRYLISSISCCRMRTFLTLTGNKTGYNTDVKTQKSYFKWLYKIKLTLWKDAFWDSSNFCNGKQSHKAISLHIKRALKDIV